MVRRLQPRYKPFEDAISAFETAHFDDCLAVLSQHDSPEASALRARCLIRLKRGVEALSVLAMAEDPTLSHRNASELLILRISAAISIGDTDAAQAAMSGAKARSYGVGSVELESELLYYCALFDWTLGNYGDARATVESLLANQSSIPVWLRQNIEHYPFNEGYWRVRAFELLGMAAALEKDYAGQAAFLLDGFKEFDAAKCRDAYVESAMLANLAVLVRDLQNPDLLSFVRSRFERIEWCEALAKLRFETQHSIGWCSALSGDHLGGLREFRQSAEIAPTVPMRIRAILDRAFIAGQLSERFFALEQLEHGCQLAMGVDWESSPSSDRLVLLDLAMAITSFDAGKARRMLDRYMSLRTRVSSLVLFDRDSRRRGDECMAIAAVVRAEGQLDRATMVYKEAFDIWTEVGYNWRAAAAAVEIYTLTGDTAYLDVVAREAAERPRSWIASRYASIVLDDPHTYARSYN